MPQSLTALLGKTIRYIARLRGGGSALPGLFVERIDPNFISRTLNQLPRGVVVITGTNGKTTTTKMVVELLESQGLRVFTNRTGSNFIRGVAAALLEAVDAKGNLNADIAVLELDEAHGVHFTKVIKPKYSLLLNVMRDQLDRFGEIDTTTRMLASIAKATTDAVILNRDDERIHALASHLPEKNIHFFGLSSNLRHHFPTDDELHGATQKTTVVTPANIILEDIKDNTAVLTINNQTFKTPLALSGIYNIYNAVAALTLTRVILGKDYDDAQLITTLASIKPAFGRGEMFEVGGQPLEIILVKNPSGFRLSLASFPTEGYSTMMAINDNYADGRDMSWLWDVNFENFPQGVQMVSGIRAYDMALRLQYDEVAIAAVEPSLSVALRRFIEENADTPKRIYCTYTAMLALRKELAKITDVERVL